MRFPPHLLDEIRARLPVSQVVGRKVALKRKGREYAGLSPFKVEKTISSSMARPICPHARVARGREGCPD